VTTLHTHHLASFPTAPEGLQRCQPSQVVHLSDGDTYDLRIAPVANRLGDHEVRMLAYNGSIPGPTLRVAQGSTVTVRVRNDGDHETTVHWHGLRLDNAYDGVPHETQAPIPVGGEFTYRLRLPDDGVYWYHPHVREDYGIEMGLYGNIIVDAPNENAWPAVHREDILIEDGRIAPFRVAGPTHTAMGRFGNVMLTGGFTDLTLQAAAGEVVRFYLTNTANTRIFDITVPGARMKLVGGDSGRYEHEDWADTVLLAPSERAVVDIQFPHPGTYPLQHHPPGGLYQLGTIIVTDAKTGTPTHAFDTLHTNADLARKLARLDADRRRPADKTLVFTASMPLLYGDTPTSGPAYACPMHPEVTSTEPGTCPKCGMKLVAAPPAATYACPMHPDLTSTEPGTCPKCGMKLVAGGDAASHGAEGHDDVHAHGSGDGLEWEDLMPEINAQTDASNMSWNIVDQGTGAKNTAIDWRFTVGDQVKLRLVNTMDSDHPMHHPFHVHGAGRFIVLARDDVPEANLVWKDTVLVRAGETVDILLELTEPGLWMAHCHIAEHNQDGMMFSFRVVAA
jgi:FtsP/CotA-like multicopper oxidase with cupredoxin domain